MLNPVNMGVARGIGCTSEVPPRAMTPRKLASVLVHHPSTQLGLQRGFWKRLFTTTLCTSSMPLKVSMTCHNASLYLKKDWCALSMWRNELDVFHLIHHLFHASNYSLPLLTKWHFQVKFI